MSKTSNSIIEQLQANAPLHELVRMHRYRRPGGSVSEQEFSDTYIAPLTGVTQDQDGNWIGKIGENPTVLWSSHTDTVHRETGTQRLGITHGGAMLGLATTEDKSSCLGADCTVGVWIMRQMYLAGIPGLYIWHAEEETGGLGSTAIAQHSRYLLENIQAAIAFDRKGLDSVITHQWGSRTASDTFAISLAKFLGGTYTPDSGGTFTDTANYEHIIPECTNISVGYYAAHTKGETLDLTHAEWLLQRMLQFDASVLEIARDPTAKVIKPVKWGNNYSVWENMDIDPQDEMYHLVSRYPDEVAEMLQNYGITADDLRAEIGLKPKRH